MKFGCFYIADLNFMAADQKFASGRLCVLCQAGVYLGIYGVITWYCIVGWTCECLYHHRQSDAHIVQHGDAV